MSLLNSRQAPHAKNIALRVMVAALCNASLVSVGLAATTKLSDQPIITTVNVPANVVFPISVEYPTAISVAHPAAFAASTKYDGYFDPLKCYDYNSSGNYFVPVGLSNATTYACSGKWSGTLLNWATMQTIDLFRWVMTGGYRSIDLPTSSADSSSPLTVLQRAYASSQGSLSNFPDRSISAALAASYTPYGSNGVTFGNWKKGLQFTAKVGSNTRTFNAAVKVCDPAFLESNCSKYKVGSVTSYKPEGLMQQNRDSMMFSVFAYLNRGDGVAHGGVMRARSRHLMAPNDNPIGAGVARPGVAVYEATEIADLGAFVTNPDTFDAANSPGGAETRSGAMNYINGFGMISQNYMTYDSVSLIYAEALKYMKGLEPTPSYTSDLNASTKAYQDNFPVVKDWKRAAGSTTMDPMLRWCQKNFFVGIGDVNSWYDKCLSGSGCEPAGVDNAMGTKATAHAWTAYVGSQETGMSNLATRSNINGDGTGYNFSNGTTVGSTSSCCGGNSFYMAGMAYYANTEDIRPSLAKPSGKKTTIQTYWVDVLEFQQYKHRNQYWLAAKYGGFVDSDGDSKPNLASEWVSTTTSPAGVMPKNYFPAANAQMLADGLKQAFKQIRQSIAEGSGVGVSSPSLTLGSGAGATMLYKVTYDSSGWGGTVQGLNITSINASDGTVNTSPVFSTDTSLFQGKGATWWQEGGRVIATGKWSGTTFTPIPFHWASLTSAQQTALGGQTVLNFLRGDKSLEGSTYRARVKALGDIVDSQAVYLGASDAPYSDEYNTGYASYKTSKKNRTPVIFVGANDGMLHAIHGTTGVELWAYVPSFLFQGPSSPATPAVDGLQALSSPAYAHRNYVDATPYIQDVDFSATGGTTTGTGDWHTLLVGGLGKGGKGYYAIDVSDASAITSVSTLTSKVLWEFTDPDMGFTYGRPVIVKTRRWGWVVILTGGYNNITGSTGTEGRGVIYIVNAKTGALLQKVYTPAGSITDPSGLAHISAYVPDYTDYTALNVYGGDLMGNVWRFDLTSATASIPAPSVAFAQLTDGSVAQPVTTEPQIEYESGNLKRWVFVGTGRLLHADDSGSSQKQTFYAIRDGSNLAAWDSSTIPSGFSFPIQRSALTPVTNLTTGATLTASNPLGWYHDLTGVDSNAGGTATERIVVNPASVAGADIITWVGAIPSTDPCSPGGTSRYYQTDFATGHSLLLDSSLAPVSFWSLGDQVVGYSIVKNGVTTSPLLTTTQSILAPANPAGNVRRPQIFNWRLIGQ